MVRILVFLFVAIASFQVTVVGVAQQSSQTADLENPFANGMLGALYISDVQKELELVEDQKSALKQLVSEINIAKDEIRTKLESFSRNASEAEVAAKRKELIRQLEEFKKRSEKSFYAVLLPHQKERLGQVTAQLMLRESAKMNAVGVLAPEMKEFLGIEEKQAERIQRRAKEINKRVAEEIKKIAEEAKAEMMDELTPEQQRKYKSLIGDPIKGRLNYYSLNHAIELLKE